MDNMKRMFALLLAFLWVSMSQMPTLQASPRESFPILIEGRLYTVLHPGWKPSTDGTPANAKGEVYESGVSQGSVLLTQNQGRRTGLITLKNGKRFQLTWAGERVSTSALEQPPIQETCSVRPPGAPFVSLHSAIAQDTTPASVDILVLWTVAAKNRAGGEEGIRTRIDLAIAEANQALADSGVQATVNLIRAEETAYSEGPGMQTDLTRLATANDGYMDDVFNLKSKYGADLVCLFNDSPDPNIAGIAYLLSSSTDWPFSVVQIRYAVGYFVFIHELGHNFGCSHDVENAGGGAISYGHGYRLTAEGTLYRTIMAYAPGARLGYFSNPHLAYKGVPLGDASTADNARVIRERSGLIAAISPPAQVKIRVTMNGSGSVECNGVTMPASGITVPRETSLGLTARASNGARWVGWSGDLSSAANPLVRSAQRDLNIVANFSDGPSDVAPIILTEPQSTNLPYGGELRMSVTAVGIPEPEYQWQHNGLDLPHATAPELVIPSAVHNHGGAYSVLVINAAGGVQSERAIVNVGDTPEILEQPLSQYAEPGSTVTFRVRVSSAESATYQWRWNGQDLPGATTATLVLPNIDQTNEGIYTVFVTTPTGGISSEPAGLGVIAPPRILKQPSKINTIRGSSAVLTVEAVGHEPLEYQWYLNDQPISGAKNSSLALPNLQPSQAGYYFVVASNPFGYTTSTQVLVTVNVPLVILTQPQDIVAPRGSTPIFKTVADGSAPITYQWRFNGEPLSNQVYSTCRLRNVQPQQAGVYLVDIMNPAGLVTSEPARLIVTDPPVITQQPQPVLLREGESGTLNVGVEGAAELRYQWSRNGQTIAGATASSYEISAASYQDDGTYTVAIANADGKVISNPAMVSVLIRPEIMKQPVPVTILPGQTASFTVICRGTSPLRYTWSQGGLDLPNCNSSTLVLTEASQSIAGEYRVRVENDYGTAVSLPARLTVLQPPVIIRQPSSITVLEGNPARLEVKAEGAPELRYQWKRSPGTSLQGATNSSFEIARVTPQDAGIYFVEIQNADGKVVSLGAKVTVNTPPVILDQLPNRTAAHYTTLSMEAMVRGTEIIRYQWFRGQEPLVGATGKTLVFPSLKATDAGDYWFSASNAYGQTNSQPARLNVTAPPVILQQPTSVKVLPPSSVTLAPVVEGTSPLSYQWYRNGAVLPNETQATLILVAPLELESATYHFVAANRDGKTQSAPIRVTAPFAPRVTQQPEDVIATNLQEVVWSVEVVSSTAVTYEWYKDQIPLHGIKAASWSMTVTNATAAGDYWVVASNEAGSITSRHATLTFIDPPVITQQPSPQILGANMTAVFTVKAIGKGPLGYAWTRKESDAVLSTGPELRLESVDESKEGFYWVTITNEDGSTRSLPAELRIVEAPVFTLQPKDAAVTPGSRCTLEAQVKSEVSVSAQWFRDGALLAGATGLSLNISSAQGSDDGIYQVVVSNVAGSADSRLTTVQVVEPPIILEPPHPTFAAPETTVTLSVLAAGAQPLQYQWLRDGSVVEGQTGSLFKVDSNAASNGARYQVVVWNKYGTNTTAPVTVTLISPPMIIRPPDNAIVEKGGSAVLTCEATGGGNLQYLWSFNGVAVANATGPTLLIRNAQLSDEGSYEVAVHNEAGSASSRPASVTVKFAPSILAQPVSLELKAGVAARFSVQAAGRPELVYQWKKNRIPMAGQKQSELVISAVGASDAATYSVEVSNQDGLVESRPANLVVSAPPVVLEEPKDLAVNLGAYARFAAVATGTGPLAYQWYFNGSTPVNGATGPELVIQSTQLSQAGAYQVEIRNAYGSVRSGSANLTVESDSLAPTFLTQPSDVRGIKHDDVTLSAMVAGTAPLNYQWYRDINSELHAIPGQTNTTLSLLNVTEGVDSGYYELHVTNRAGSAISTKVLVSITDPPLITRQPAGGTAAAGASFTFSVLATGKNPLRYQWYKNLVPIANETKATLTLTRLVAGDAGSYTVRITNDGGVTTSNPAILTMLSGPTILTQPQGKAIPLGSSATLICQASGTGPLTYYWRKDKATFGWGIDKTTLVIPAFASTDEGTYSVLVSNSVGQVTSAGAVLSTAQPPAIIRQPTNLTVKNGDPASLSVAVTGRTPLTYQWYKNGRPVAGANAAECRIAPTTYSDQADYYVQVSNVDGQVTSGVATLTLGFVPKFTVQPQSARLALGEKWAFSVATDPGNGIDWYWYRNGDWLGPNLDTNRWTFTAAQQTAGAYTVVASNIWGCSTSTTATITLRQPPLITQAPTSLTVNEGSTATLFVQTDPSSGPVRFEWRRANQLLRGPTNAWLVFNNVQPENAGQYTVTVINQDGAVTPPPALLTVRPLPVIFQQPQIQILTLSNSFTLSVGARSPDPMEYQWLYNGSPIPGSIADTLTVLNAQEAQSGEYAVRVANSVGAVFSEPATVIVLPIQPTKLPKAQKEARVLHIARTKSKQAGMLFLGERGRTYVVEVSEDLQNWTVAGQVTLKEDLGQFIDSQASSRPARFYRITTQ